MVAAIATFVVIVAAVAGYTFLVPPQYTATAELFATYASQGESQNSSDMNSGASYLSTQIQTYPQLVKTEAVLKPVIKELGLDMTTDELAGKVTATNPSNTFMVDVSVQDGNAEQSARIANSVAKNLSEQISSSLYTDESAKSPIQLNLVQKARTPQSPSSPKVGLYLAAGVVLGLICGVGMALLLDVINTRVEGSSDVRELTKASSLGSIQRSELLDEPRPVVISQPSSKEAEEFRKIRTNISFLAPNVKEHGHLLVFTSTRPGEGKTTTATNTAAAIAEVGKSVLLIDADLRHPSVAKEMGIEGHVGLSHILSAQATPRDVVQRYWKQNLHVLPAGKRPANASVLLNSELMTEMVEQALTQYDYVIIDTAPLSVANDASVFGRMAHGLILVVGRGVAEKKDLADTTTSLKEADVPILGFVLNFADEKKHSNKNGNYYYYYYDESTGNHGGSKHSK